MATAILVFGFLAINIGFARWLRLRPSWLVWVTGIVGLVLAGTGPLSGAASTVAIAQLVGVSAVEDARTYRLPLPITQLLYAELLLASMWEFGAERSPLAAGLGALIWVAALAPGVAIRQLGLGDLLLAPALGGWVGAAAGAGAALLAVTGAFVGALVSGRASSGKVPLGPWLYLGWLISATLISANSFR